MCGHCNETCDADGVKGEAFQCDLCEGWFHTLCENIGSKRYKSFSSLKVNTKYCILLQL